MKKIFPLLLAPTMSVLPKHKLEGENMQESDFFRHPIGTGPYKLDRWDEGQAITLIKNEDYFKGEANIDRIIFKDHLQK